MAVQTAGIEPVHDALKATWLTLRSSWPRLLRAWIYTPAGVFVVLLYCWGVDSVIQQTGISFPASVACMILLFLFLTGITAFFGERKIKGLMKLIDIPLGFSLRWINVFFVPSFVTLPLSPSIGGVEIAKIIAVFFIGFVFALAFCAYMVRGLQLLTGTSKRVSEDTEDSDRDVDLQATIPLTNVTPPPEPTDQITPLPPPAPAAEPARVRGPGPEVAFAETQVPVSQEQQGIPPSRATTYATYLTLHLDTITYFILFLVSLPILYTTGYFMPIHLTLTVLTFKFAFSLPVKVRRILHPVLVCSVLMVFLIYIISLTVHGNFFASLRAYSTKTRYLSLFHGETSSLPLPGAGDIFASALDVSIVGLAVPMYNYRKALKTHFVSIFVPCLVMGFGSVLLYPIVCYHIGIAPTRSISFTSRSLTLALATPAVENMGGDLNLVAVLCIMSGIIGVLIGDPVLKWLRIPEDDYVTRGVTLGVNSSAISTAELLRTFPRAAAMSSLAIVIFGMTVVVLSAIGGMVNIVEKLAGLA